jgi:hypothetical protein
MLDAERQLVNGATWIVSSTLNRASHSRKDLMPLPDIANYLMLSVVNSEFEFHISQLVWAGTLSDKCIIIVRSIGIKGWPFFDAQSCLRAIEIKNILI